MYPNSFLLVKLVSFPFENQKVRNEYTLSSKKGALKGQDVLMS